ncbi:MAG: class I SAM-dependent methyltransferase [Dongiaceae bacterium]
MANRTITLSDRLHDYYQRVSLREPDVLRALREETATLPLAVMQISPEQGQLMRLLIELTGTRRAIEVGTYTGYSALCVALAMGPEGRLIACDINPETTAVAQRYWRRAGVADRIDLRLAPALATLDQLLQAGGAGQFDFGFIDANKEDYDGYYERLLTLLRPGGLVAIDNVLWGGDVADPTKTDAETTAIRALNDKVHGDARVEISMIPIGDGLTLARKR